MAGLLALPLAILLGASAGEAGQAAPRSSRLRVAVLSFAGMGGPAGLGDALGQVLRDGMRQVRGLESVKSGALMESAGRLSLSLGSSLSDDELLRLGRDLRLRGLVTGTYTAEGGSLKVQARLADLGGPGRVVRAEETAGTLAGFVALQARVLREVLSRLAVRPTEYDDRRIQAVLGEPTGSLEAYILYGRGAWHLELGSKEGQEEAVRLLTRATEADENFPLARVALGASLLATNNRWKGSQEVRKALQINPNLAESHRMLAEMLASSPRRPYDLTIQAYLKTAELAPDWAEVWVGLGDAYQAKGRFDEAVLNYQKALALEPNNARVHYGMGKIYYNEKQLYHEAVAEYQRAIALDPGLLEAHLSLADLYGEKGLYQEAIARYDYVLSLDARHPGATYGLAMAYEEVDRNKAIVAWERYIELASTLASEKEWVDIAKKHLAKLRREKSR
ncbi:MAG: tetratricopeptide repeat protein [candidate division NC10 bacterium]|nr:tetratricopeptide repeat protein [candidate division NC10 bacterium]